jgi:hypothetical protein
MTGFRVGAAYGFELVDATGWRFFRENSHQSKIYAESNSSDFRQNFRQLISMQALAIYRRLLSQGLIARDQAQRNQTDG